MAAVRELRRRVRDVGFVGLRVVPWLWNVPLIYSHYYQFCIECVRAAVSFCACARVGHT